MRGWCAEPETLTLDTGLTSPFAAESSLPRSLPTMKRAVIAWTLTLAAGTTSVQADEIHLFEGKSLTNVRVHEETNEKVTYSRIGERQKDSKELDLVKEVVYKDATKDENYANATYQMSQGQFDSAAQLFKAVAANPPKSLPWVKQYAMFNLAECARARAQYDNAIRYYDDLLKKVPNTRFFADCYLNKAECFNRKGDSAEVARVCDQLKLDADTQGLGPRSGLRADLFLASVEEQGNATKAMEMYAALATKAANDDVPDVANAARLRLATAKLKEKNLDEARRLFEQVIEARQASSLQTVAAAYNGLGRSYVEKGAPGTEDYGAALHAFLRTGVHYADKLGKDDLVAQALYYAGRCLEERTTDPTESGRRAKFLYSRVMKEFPSSEWAKLASER